MLKSRAVVLDFEGFGHKKSGFIIKEIAVFTENYIDTVSFLPPASFNTLSLSEQKSYRWVSSFFMVWPDRAVTIRTVIFNRFVRA